jgi:hypothetical protein
MRIGEDGGLVFSPVGGEPLPQTGVLPDVFPQEMGEEACSVDGVKGLKLLRMSDLIEKNIEDVITSVIKRAKGGDVQSAKLLLDYFSVSVKDQNKIELSNKTFNKDDYDFKLEISLHNPEESPDEA